MTKNCERAQELVKLASSDPQQQKRAQDLVKACCGKEDARECIEQLAAIGADVACRAYTDNACGPCCTFVSGIVAKVFTDILYETGIGGVIEEYWDLGRAIVNSVFPGDCDFDPAKNDAEAKAIEAAQAQAEALRVAWVEVHKKLGIKLPGWSENGNRIRVKVYQGNVWEFSPYPTFLVPVDLQTATWSELLLNRAQINKTDKTDPGSKRFRDYLNIADSSWGAMWFDPVAQTNRSLQSYMKVRFSHWRCDRADQFGEALARALNLRLRGIGEAREYFTRRLGLFYTERYKPPVFSLRVMAPRKPSPLRAVATTTAAAAACGILGGTWYLLRR